MRRVYINKGPSRVKTEAMSQYRRTRAKLMEQHGDLMESIRHKLSPPAMPQGDPTKVDREKSLHTVMKFLEMRQASPAFQQELKKILLETQKSG